MKLQYQSEHFVSLVVTGLVMNGDKQDEDTPGGLVRLQAVRTLCQMNPSQALNVRTLCVSLINVFNAFLKLYT